MRKWQVSEEQVVAFTPSSWRAAYRTVALGLPAVPLQVVSYVDRRHPGRALSHGVRAAGRTRTRFGWCAGATPATACCRPPRTACCAPGPGPAPPTPSPRAPARRSQPIVSWPWAPPSRCRTAPLTLSLSVSLALPLRLPGSPSPSPWLSLSVSLALPLRLPGSPSPSPWLSAPWLTSGRTQDADWSASDELIVATTMAKKVPLDLVAPSPSSSSHRPAPPQVYVLRSATGEQVYEVRSAASLPCLCNPACRRR